MLLNKNTVLPAAPAAKPVQYALKALRRDFDRVFADTAAPGGRILLTINDTLPAEQYTLTADADTLLLSAADDLGFVYGLFEISRRFLGVQPFWFWNDQPFTMRDGEKIAAGTVVESKPSSTAAGSSTMKRCSPTGKSSGVPICRSSWRSRHCCVWAATW